MASEFSELLPDAVDVAYAQVESPFGHVFMAASRNGVVRIGLPGFDERSVVADLQRDFGPQVTRSVRVAEVFQAALDEFFAGAEPTISFDLSRVSGFQLRALAAMQAIPFGATRSYAQVAEAAGSPRAYRAVGSACARNPIPLLIPCHRVIRSDGNLGQYFGGIGLKEALLLWEERHGLAQIAAD